MVDVAQSAVTFTHQTVCMFVCLRKFLPQVRAINETVSQSDAALHPVQEVTSRAGPVTVCEEAAGAEVTL